MRDRLPAIAVLLTALVAAAYGGLNPYGAGQGKMCPSSAPWHCGDGKGCYSTAMSCNGQKDCQNELDEMYCPKRVCQANKPYKCKNGNGCYSPFEWCNGVANCNDGSDEPQAECALAWLLVFQAWEDYYTAYAISIATNPVQTGCSDEKPFQCANKRPGECYGYTDWCNFKNDCSDASDEPFGQCLKAWTIVWQDYALKAMQLQQQAQANQCPTQKPFKCNNGRGCYSVGEFCNLNEKRHCSDGSDEPWATGECAVWWTLAYSTSLWSEDDKKRDSDWWENLDLDGDKKRAVKRGFITEKRAVKRDSIDKKRAIDLCHDGYLEGGHYVCPPPSGKRSSDKKRAFKRFFDFLQKAWQISKSNREKGVPGTGISGSTPAGHIQKNVLK